MIFGLKEHLERTQEISISLGRELELTSKEIALLSLAAKNHDIGKLLIPHMILNKEKKLEKKEIEKIKTHPELSVELLSLTGVNDEVLLRVIREHHERVDGKGYPDGLKKEEIHYLSLMLSLCDSYDVMRSKRSYKEPYSKKKIIKELEENLGSQFDKDIGKIFIALIKKDLI